MRSTADIKFTDEYIMLDIENAVTRLCREGLVVYRGGDKAELNVFRPASKDGYEFPDWYPCVIEVNSLSLKTNAPSALISKVSKKNGS